MKKNNEKFIKDFISKGNIIIPASFRMEETPNGELYFWSGRKLNPAGLSPVLHKYSSFDKIVVGRTYRIVSIDSIRYYKNKETGIEEVTMHVTVEAINV